MLLAVTLLFALLVSVVLASKNGHASNRGMSTGLASSCLCAIALLTIMFATPQEVNADIQYRATVVSMQAFALLVFVIDYQAIKGAREQLKRRCKHVARKRLAEAEQQHLSAALEEISALDGTSRHSQRRGKVRSTSRSSGPMTLKKAITHSITQVGHVLSNHSSTPKQSGRSRRWSINVQIAEQKAEIATATAKVVSDSIAKSYDTIGVLMGGEGSRKLLRKSAPQIDWVQAMDENQLPLPQPFGTAGADNNDGESSPASPHAAVSTATCAGHHIRELLKDAEFLPADRFRERLKQVTSSLRQPSYGLKQFHDDMIECFPELKLYVAGSVVSSGIHISDEYKRTIGALFAVYWLFRLALPGVEGSEELDGQRGFCFGVGADWKPPSAAVVATCTSSTSSTSSIPGLEEKRVKFYQTVDWEQLHALLLHAGILRRSGQDGAVEVDHDRAAAMLTLTAIHDIMKISSLQPTVLAEHGPFEGYESGSPVIDHDTALAYVLTHDAEALPSFSALPANQQRSVLFTQAYLGFNHGWLVQAEAPPGALFTRMKQVVSEAGTHEQDIAFYFVHWLTDLAGAVPTPLHGAEKFAKNFPVMVLQSFIRSFSVVQRLAVASPTQVMEDFLNEWWPTELGSQPTDSIALMRLVVQVQMIEPQRAVFSAFQQLDPADWETLQVEMATTGISGERLCAAIKLEA